MADFSDKSSAEKVNRISISILLKYVREAIEASRQQPPKRFRAPKSEMGLKFEER